MHENLQFLNSKQIPILNSQFQIPSSSSPPINPKPEIQNPKSIPPSFREALLFWFQLGWISFGGPAGQIALMQQELVDRRQWINQERFSHALNYCLLLPGPEAQQLATYCGWLLHGPRGAWCAGVLFILPAFFILCTLSAVYLAFGHIPIVNAVLDGMKAVVVALVIHALVRLSRKNLRLPLHAALAGLAFLALLFGHLPFPLILLTAATVGWFQPNPKSADSSALDSTPRNNIRWWTWPFLGAGLWLGPFLLLSGLFTEMALFFSKLALVTFGGAYAVLPYLMQEATEHYHWLTPTQMLDGLALGETTPGPLIMIVTYTGFVAGAKHGWSSAILGATVATYFTFLPSFLFILIGAPYVERLRRVKWLQRVLTAITAAVVGIIGTLAVTLATHVFFQHGAIQTNLIALSLVAYFLLHKKVNVLFVLAGAAAAAQWVR